MVHLVPYPDFECNLPLGRYYFFQCMRTEGAKDDSRRTEGGCQEHEFACHVF